MRGASREASDEALPARAARDGAAFEPLVLRHSAAPHGHFARRAPEAADGLLAERWLQAYAARRGFDTARGPARARLFGVARNALSAHWRRTPRHGHAAAPGMKPIGHAEDSKGRAGARSGSRRGAGTRPGRDVT